MAMTENEIFALKRLRAKASECRDRGQEVMNKPWTDERDAVANEYFAAEDALNEAADELEERFAFVPPDLVCWHGHCQAKWDGIERQWTCRLSSSAEVCDRRCALQPDGDGDSNG